MKNAMGFVLVSLLSFVAAAQPDSPLKPTRTIALPQVNGRFDHLAYDAQRHRLYVAASANNTVEVVDVPPGKPLAPLPINDPHDLLVLPKPNLLYVTSGTDGVVKVFDCAAERAIKTIGRLPDADNLRFDAPANRIYVAYGDGALAMINAQTGVQTVAIPLPGHPEAFAIEALDARIFVNVPAKRQIAVIERLSREVIATWSPGTNAANYALALDEANQRLFVGCRQPPRLVVLGTKSGKLVTETEIAGDVDNLFYDAQRKRLYASCGEGFIECIAQSDADHYQALPRLATAKGARTCLFVEDSGQLFLAVPHRESQPAEIRVFSVVR
jgi:DNA-binding beta-propeller fold protein YncE